MGLSKQEEAALGFRDPTQHSKNAVKHLMEDAPQIFRAFQKKSEEDFNCFYRGLFIEAKGGKRVFESVGAGFQRRCFDIITPNLQALRDGDMPDKRRFWIERTKKASKDADLAVMLSWVIAFPKRPFYAQVAAADREQAGIVKDRITSLLEYNPWLNERLELVNNQIRSKKQNAAGLPLAKADILAADVGGSHGATPDLLIVNELSHIVKWEFVQNLLDNADGVPTGMVIIATNAGYVGTKPFMWRSDALASDAWSVHVLAEPAPWHSYQTLREAKARNPHSRYMRLWQGRWVSGKGDAVDEDKIDRAFKPGLTVLQEAERGWEYLMGIDLGVKHDHSGVVVVGVNVEQQRIRLAFQRRWKPVPIKQPDGTELVEVDLIDVEKTIAHVYRHYRCMFAFYDPHQAKFLAQRLARKGVMMREMSFQTPANLVKMATAFQQALDSGKLECYDDEEGTLRGDFAKFNIVEKSYGVRLEAISDESGHADVGTALIITMPYAVDALQGMGGLRPDDDLIDTDDSDMTDEEVADMPDDLRDIYEMDGVEATQTKIRQRKLKPPKAGDVEKDLRSQSEFDKYFEGL